LILTQSFCGTEGLSLTPPPSNELYVRTAANLAAITAGIMILLMLLLLGCVTFMFCPNRCGSSPTWCCPCPRLFKWI
jgi:hypothetical protein